MEGTPSSAKRGELLARPQKIMYNKQMRVVKTDTQEGMRVEEKGLCRKDGMKKNEMYTM